MKRHKGDLEESQASSEKHLLLTHGYMIAKREVHPSSGVQRSSCDFRKTQVVMPVHVIELNPRLPALLTSRA